MENTTIDHYMCYRINAPNLYTPELAEYLRTNQAPGLIATWHDPEVGRFGEYSDIFVTIDGDEGSNSNMPGWDKIVELCKKIDPKPDGIVWLSNL